MINFDIYTLYTLGFTKNNKLFDRNLLRLIYSFSMDINVYKMIYDDINDINIIDKFLKRHDIYDKIELCIYNRLSKSTFSGVEIINGLIQQIIKTNEEFLLLEKINNSNKIIEKLLNKRFTNYKIKCYDESYILKIGI